LKKRRIDPLNTRRPKILITFPFFLPAFKAGGPIQSIANLCRQLSDEFEFFIVCGDRDMYDPNLLSGITRNEWNDFEEGKAKVFYLPSSGSGRRSMARLIRSVSPDLVFINGLYSPVFSLIPLFRFSGKRILSARGMLHPGALTQKSRKKEWFIRFIKWSGVPGRVVFHATDQQERDYIHQVFGAGVSVRVAQNFANRIIPKGAAEKHPGDLRIVTIALISPMKNHLLVLQALRNCKANVRYDIYGPVKDESYWQQCQALIRELPSNITVSYKGSIDPARVSETLQQYHGFVMPSKSENFGHALYESLSMGLPVLTSNFTPWNNLQEEQAGWNLSIENEAELTAALEELAGYDQYRQNLLYRGALQKAEKAVDFEQIKQQYRQLFAETSGHY
jgi:glycosyltransferase involved in cell wall biosynthesis